MSDLTPEEERYWRQRVQKLLDDAEALIADSQYLGRRRPDLAPRIAPDEMVDVYRNRDWAKAALDALDAGDPLPPFPEPAGE